MMIKTMWGILIIKNICLCHITYCTAGVNRHSLGLKGEQAGPLLFNIRRKESITGIEKGPRGEIEPCFIICMNSLNIITGVNCKKKKSIDIVSIKFWIQIRLMSISLSISLFFFFYIYIFFWGGGWFLYPTQL